MRLVSVVLICLSAVLSGCGGNASEHKRSGHDTNIAAIPPQSKLNAEGTAALVAMLASYYELKDALVATNAGEADAAANKLSENTDRLQQAMKEDSTNVPAYTGSIDTMKSEIAKMTAMMDEGCERKRIHFDAISASMYSLVKKAELKNANIYHQYCPMAFNDKGAYWLSNEEEIKNPYFGDKMLECGEVTDIIN
jgi:hypothetical protein